MSLEMESPVQNDRTIVQILGEPEDELEWAVLAYLGEYLWQNFGLEIDCDFVELHLVYGDDAGAAAPPAVAVKAGG